MPLLSLLRPLALSLFCAAPAAAQIYYQDFSADGGSVFIDGPWKRYQTHVLQYGDQSYGVLFRPGFADAATALRAITPLCSARGMQASVAGSVAPVEILLTSGEDSVHQGYRIDCVKAK